MALPAVHIEFDQFALGQVVLVQREFVRDQSGFYGCHFEQ